MKSFLYRTAVEQLAEHLHSEIIRGELSGEMPGVDKLAANLKCSQRTVLAALKHLESEGLLQKQGAGRRSLITPRKNLAPASLRVTILLYEQNDAKSDYMVNLRHQLQEMGHTAGFAEKSLYDLGMNVGRVARFVKKSEGDAWIIFGGSRDILGWFAAGPVPAFALFGRMGSLSLAGAGPDKSSAIAAVARHLTELGHRRIVFLAREERRKPKPGAVERAFLETLQAEGVPTGPYNLPDWEDNPKGFDRCLTSLFQHSPPTALIPDTLELYTATMHFLNRRAIRVPEDVSLVCTDPHPSFAWCIPPIGYIDYDSNFWVQKASQWVNKVARGQDDRRQVYGAAKFVDGATIGPVRKKG